MMKKMKKIMALFLAMAMVLGMSMTTFAANELLSNGLKITGTNSDRGTITIKNVEDGTLAGNNADGSAKIRVYKIVEAEYNNAGSFSGYKVVDTYKDIMTNDDYVTLTPTILDSLGKKALADGTAVSVTEGWKYDGEHKTYSTEHKFEVGRYLIVLTGSDSVIYNYAVASIYYTTPDANGNNQLVNGDLDLNTTEGITLSVGEAYIKANSHPDVTKTATKTVNGQKVSADTANIGDEIEYTVEINPIPYYGGENPVLNVVDTLDKGLSLADINADGNLSVVVRETSDKDNTEIPVATLTANDFAAASGKDGEKDTLTVDFVIGNPKAYKLNGYAGKKVVITYKATLTNDALINEGGNENNVVLNFTKDSKVTDGDDTDTTKTNTYTFDIGGSVTANIFKKTGEGTDAQKLPGATFKLFTDANATVPYTGTGVIDDNNKNGVAVSDANGNIQFKGLAAGTYFLKETAAPDNYTLNSHIYKIEIAPTITNGKLESWKIIVDGVAEDPTKGKTSTFSVSYDESGNAQTPTGSANTTEIKNTKMTILPSTGGIGTTIFTIGGCAIMILAAALYFATRRKTVK